MNTLEIVKNETFNNVKCDFYINTQTKEIYMTRTQIGMALGYTDPNRAIANMHNRNKERMDKFSVVIKMSTTDGKAYDTYLYNPKGVYEICRYSNQPKANDFYDWVYDVLERIRTTGGYILGEENMTDDELIAKAMMVLNKKLEQAHKQLEEAKPKIIFADSVSESNDTILIRDLAKILNQNGIDIGEKRLFEKLRNNGYLIKAKGKDYNSPTQKSMNLGLMRVKENSITHSSGYTTIIKTPLITGKGQMYFINKFKAGVC